MGTEHDCIQLLHPQKRLLEQKNKACLQGKTLKEIQAEEERNWEKAEAARLMDGYTSGGRRKSKRRSTNKNRKSKSKSGKKVKGKTGKKSRRRRGTRTTK